MAFKNSDGVMEEDGSGWGGLVETSAERRARLREQVADTKASLVSELVEALDNVTASLETVMTWYGESMGREDRLSRFKNIADAKALIAKVRT